MKITTILILCFLSPNIDMGILDVSLNSIYGDNWVFEPRHKRGSYPREHKLLSLLSRHSSNSLNELQIPPISLVKIGSKYFCSEGNHRLYISKLLNKKTIKASVIDYDYTFLLNNSNLIIKPYGTYISYNNMLEEISEEQLLSYQNKQA